MGGWMDGLRLATDSNQERKRKRKKVEEKKEKNCKNFFKKFEKIV